MKKSLSIALVFLFVVAGAASVGVLMFDDVEGSNPENMEFRLENLKDRYASLKENFSEFRRMVENRLEHLENRISELREESIRHEFSFENGMEEWTARGTDLDNPPIEWSIERSSYLSSDGENSLKYELVNNNDAGKIWIEKPFEVEPETEYRVTVSYDFASKDYGVNLWKIITGAYADRPLKDKESSLMFQGDTGTGGNSLENHKWMEKSYEFTVTSDEDGEIYVNIGVWGTWETKRIYFVDNVEIELEKF